MCCESTLIFFSRECCRHSWSFSLTKIYVDCFPCLFPIMHTHLQKRLLLEQCVCLFIINSMALPSAPQGSLRSADPTGDNSV